MTNEVYNLTIKVNGECIMVAPHQNIFLNFITLLDALVNMTQSSVDLEQ